MRLTLRIFLATGLLVARCVCAAEETPADPLRIPVGQVVEKLTSRSDPAMSYSLYLPAAYSADRRWPLLIAMDPRGRALIPMELYRETAEQLGYIVVSSYDTRSDAAWAPNVQAMKAIMADIPQIFAIDDHRIYLTGFSGTAMGGWSFANNMSPHVAGLINFGGAVYDWSMPVKGAAYSFFGASGAKDFNYEEMRKLDKTLESLDISHRILFFDGAHEWGPKEICSEGLEWMELQAMKTNLRGRDQKWVDEMFAKRMKIAQQKEATGDLFNAYREYKSIRDDFEGLEPVEVASKKAEALGDSKAIKSTIKKMDRLAEEQQEFVQKLFAYLDEAHFPSEPKAEMDRLNDLEIASLIKQGANAKDPLDALWAQRMLQIAYVQTSFYVPRKYLESKDVRRALKVLALADRIEPNAPRVLYMKAWAAVVANERQNAVKFLNQMADSGTIPSADALMEDQNFAPLRQMPEFTALIESLRSPAKP